MLLKKEIAKQNNFKDIANIILNNTIFHVKKKQFRISEIEFYFCNKDHEDKYTHCDQDQLNFNTFYFHKFKNGTYKSGTFKGLDITLGDKEKETYFGVLIRSMLDIETTELIEGPCRCVNKILEQFDLSTVKEFLKDKKGTLDIYKRTNQIYLTKKDLKKENIYCGPRIGLSDKYPQFLNKKYRFAIYINKIKKQKIFELCI